MSSCCGLVCEDVDKRGLFFLEGSSPLSYLVVTVEGGWGELDFTERQAFSPDSSLFRQAKLEPKGPRVRGRGRLSTRTGHPRGSGYLAPLVTSGLRTYDDNGCIVAAASVLRVGAKFCSVRTRQRTVP